MTPSEWYAHLNRRVFFWVNEARLDRLLNTYRERDKIVLVLDSARVLARHAAQAMLSPINSGFSLRFPQRRGRGTFLVAGGLSVRGMGAQARRGRRRGGMHLPRRRDERGRRRSSKPGPSRREPGVANGHRPAAGRPGVDGGGTWRFLGVPPEAVASVRRTFHPF